MLQSLKDAFSKSDELIMITDDTVEPEETKVLYTNPPFTELTGYKAEEMESLASVHSRDIDPATLKIYKETRANKESYSGFVLGEKKSGEYFWVDLTVVPLHDDQNDCWYFIHKPRPVEEYELIRDRAKLMEWCDITSEMANIGLWEWYPETDRAFFSESMYALLGLERDQVLPSFELYKSCIIDEDQQKVQEALNDVAEEGGEDTQLHRIRKQDTGEIRHLLGHGKRYEAESKTLKLYGIVQDVTSQQEQLEHTRLFQQAVEASNSGIVITENKEDNPIIYSNEQFQSLTGYSAREIHGRNCRFLQKDDRDQQARYELREAINEERSVQVTLRNYRKNGDMFWNRLKVAPVKNMKGEVSHYVGVQDDITDYVNLKQYLESKIEFEEAIINSLPGIFTLINEDLEYERWNENFEDVIGYTHDEIKNMEPVDFICEEDQEAVARCVENIFEHGYDAVEACLRTKEGEKIPHYLMGERFRTEEKTYFLGYAIDISKQREYQKELEGMIRQKNTLTKEIHHRVKNNMAVVSGLLELQKEEMDDPQSRNALHNSQLRLKTMAKVHEQLYQRDKLTDIESSQFLRDLVEMLGDVYENKNIRFEQEIDSFWLNVNQAIPLGLLLNELIVNAYKHAYKGEEEGVIKVALTLKGDKVKAVVSDEGVGLPDDFNVDQPVSLGYNIINTLTKQLGADLDVDNSKKGVTVSVIFKREELRGSASNI